MNAPTSPSSAPSADDWRINRERAIALFGPAAHDWPVEIVDETGSTNADLMARLKALPRRANALTRPIVRVAYLQTAGRGRRGRAWYAEPGNALLFSVACVLPRPLEELAGLSLALGVALVDGLRSLPLAQPGQIALKWPNDVLLEGDKLAGILIETAWSTASASAVVIGIGTNVKGASELASKISAFNVNAPIPGTAPTALSRVLPTANLTDTLAAELNALEPALQRFGQSGFTPFQGRWNACHAYAGREVALFEQGVEIARGIAAGVDLRGQLLLDTPTGRQTIATGDVSLRLATEPGIA
ncbi:biotin--[acetyl-CoA-carboxylase] ligase [Paraburkholderia bonniea]|uniref:biotin--[acetyl-CoA-carboxylase] ligase n=1 Tax=Paraburkholderia bonniea TaxID=2152891 RepID=UPI0012920F98|nr:biotin--[acetyl-CoA-carboxylase] ligase [Paraburkholderia bonniea]WJF90071.1 biotin--[acetyl-CoA-carboxylase] ligase [Paraburkholderia bonniea]WJF93385.1 biotin--[acetyl-CoA-carboxylase] ligase [Paraburkholderia bonniea]